MSKAVTMAGKLAGTLKEGAQKIKAPEFKSPEFKVPEFKVPDIKLPGIKAREQKTPKEKPLARNWPLWFLASPFVIGAAILVGIPALLTLILAFTDFNALSFPKFIGLDNFRYILEEPVFHKAAWNSIVFVSLTAPVRVLAALGLALLLQRPRRGSSLYRTAVFLPTVIPDVAYALIWLWILNPIYGPLNALLGVFGLPQPAWLINPDTALPAIALMISFQLGEGFVLLLAALRGIPRDYYDAAALDGANSWKMFRYVTLPLLAPWLVLLSIRDMIVTLQSSFTAAYLMTGGDPYYATLFLPLKIYEEAFDRFDFGLASAAMLAMFAGLGVALFIVFKVVRGWGYDNNA